MAIFAGCRLLTTSLVETVFAHPVVPKGTRLMLQNDISPSGAPSINLVATYQ